MECYRYYYSSRYLGSDINLRDNEMMGYFSSHLVLCDLLNHWNRSPMWKYWVSNEQAVLNFDAKPLEYEISDSVHDDMLRYGTNGGEQVMRIKLKDGRTKYEEVSINI